MRYHNLHLPDDLRIFTVPAENLKRNDATALVYDVRVAPDRILRHYSFADRWFEVNCSFDAGGRFITEPGPVDWSFNCDICTPIRFDAGGAHSVDLCLDVLVAPDGRTHAVIDEDDFAAALAAGWLTSAEAHGARAGLADLLAIIAGQGLVAFLERLCPFTDVVRCTAQPPVEKRKAPR